MELRKFGLKYSKRILNKNIPMNKYLKIAEERGIDAALEELENDWKYRVISRSTYYRNRKLLLGLKEKADYKMLFLRYLMLLTEDMQRDKIPKEEVAAKLGYDLDVIEDFKKWMEDTGYVKIARLVILGKKYLKMSKKATKQHNVKE